MPDIHFCRDCNVGGFIRRNTASGSKKVAIEEWAVAELDADGSDDGEAAENGGEPNLLGPQGALGGSRRIVLRLPALDSE